MVWGRVTTLVLLLALVPEIVPLGAQAPNSPPDHTIGATRALTAVKESSLVRLTTDGAMATGRLIGLGRDSVTLATEAGVHTIPLAGVSDVWVRGRATVTGLWIGGAIGAVAGAVLGGVWAATGEDQENPGAAGLLGGLVGAVVGGAGGAGLGAAVGSAFPRWKHKYP